MRSGKQERMPPAGASKLCKKIWRNALVTALAAAVSFGLHSEPATAQTGNTARSGVIVVSNDRGGLVGRRAEQIEQIRTSGQRVEIRGRVCLSSCTMYLGLPQTCIDPNTSFGFHGPSYYGTALSQSDFEYWSALIASYYPAPLRGWYMREGRTRISRYFRISGRELIRLGIRQC